jgi:hypothetical protein
LVASPSSSDSSAFSVRGKYSSSSALARPTSRGSVHEAPVSQDSAMPVKARLNPAVSARIRKSQANARLAPAPAATPFTAAMTGLGIVATAVTIGL